MHSGYILRYLTKNSEGTGNRQSEGMKRWLSDTNKMHKRRIENCRSFAEDEFAALEAQYTVFLQQGQSENEAAKPMRAKKDGSPSLTFCSLDKTGFTVYNLCQFQNGARGCRREILSRTPLRHFFLG